MGELMPAARVMTREEMNAEWAQRHLSDCRGLSRNGAEWLMCSPLRDDGKPSFSVNVEKGVFNDFGNGQHGTFAQLAGLLGVEPPDCAGAPCRPRADARDREKEKRSKKQRQAAAIYDKARDKYHALDWARHPYLAEKGLLHLEIPSVAWLCPDVETPDSLPYGDKEVKPRGQLVIPIRDIRTGSVHGVEAILREPMNGTRKLSYGNKDGVWACGRIRDSKAPLVLCEGFATAATVGLVLKPDACAVCCFGLGRVGKAAIALREMFPSREIIFAADVGEKPRELFAQLNAQSARLTCAIPPDTVCGEKLPDNADWNDVYMRFGAEIAKRELEALLSPRVAAVAAQPELLPPDCWECRRPRGEPLKDPIDRAGLVGLFCRAFYPIDKAITAFGLPYVRVGDNEYAYKGDMTGQGMITSKGMYAHPCHADDPARGRMSDAFDLVRIHVYGSAPAVAKERERAIESAYRITELAEKGAIASGEFMNALNAERKALDGLTAKSERLLLDDIKTVDWIRAEIGAARAKRTALPGEDEARERERETACGELEKALDGLNDDGKYPAERANIDRIIQMHPDIKGLTAWNDFSKRITLRRAPRWRVPDTNDAGLKDRDDAEIRAIAEQYGITAKDRIYDAVTCEAQKYAFHPVRDYLSALEWDGEPRIGTALTDFFGGRPTDYTRAISELFFKAAVMRVFVPGCKYDYMLTVKGRQGCGKSTFFSKLGGEWFSDNVGDISNKDAQEGLLGAWIVEFAEMAALRKADAEQMKSFISRPCDRFRAAYGRRTEDYPRQCVFAATTNEAGFLHDQTGNRRFLVFEAGATPPKLDVFKDLTPGYRDLMFAESYAKVKADGFATQLCLPREIEEQAALVQQSYMQADPVADRIAQYLDLLLPPGWYDMGKDRRRQWAREAMDNGWECKDGRPRQFVCVREIWTEALDHLEGEEPTRLEANHITRVLDNMPDWERVKGDDGRSKTIRIPMYGVVKAFRRVG